ncbi:uncharacterized protein LACBIDRAFT_335598 [Laccaria bicolor S238N-H82]|uniref:Predicted protein n=1 Tax=Laccaria bicolor (strain S238N-H82 / ATCC MYA-4686) TaxID=486041 RepID=B0E2T3_LACBS|nr:uncharacterized protein LACBIDRAFT_335598 [Laccaria bicolor S238N-H82]EDQ98845.1 predicted protein [Laccaria bicolor S238N-H82]|eukprot:XP_001890498.1 predicted protein [Laccaria bicolor S238N-H82]
MPDATSLAVGNVATKPRTMTSRNDGQRPLIPTDNDLSYQRTMTSHRPSFLFVSSESTAKFVGHQCPMSPIQHKIYSKSYTPLSHSIPLPHSSSYATCSALGITPSPVIDVKPFTYITFPLSNNAAAPSNNDAPFHLGLRDDRAFGEGHFYLKSAMDSDTSSSAHVVNCFDVPKVLKASHLVTLHSTTTIASSKGEYKNLASILCAYRTLEVLALDGETGVPQPPIRLLPPLSFNKSEGDSVKIHPKVLLNFRKLMGQSALPQIPDNLHTGSKHLALLWMANKNNEKMTYVNVVDNFLQATLHLYYLKMTEFPDGSLPDYPDILAGRLHIFKDENSTDEFINDQEEGKYYLEQLQAGETASYSLHELGTPLQLALLLTPFYLLFPSRIITRSYNRCLVLEAFVELTPWKTPLVLQIERSIWSSLIALADVTTTPHEALTQLVLRLPWAEIEAASNNPCDCRMFCAPLDQPSSSSPPLQPSLAAGRQLAIEGASNTLTLDTQVSGPMPDASVIPNPQVSTSMRDDASLINEEQPEAHSMPSPKDHDDGGSPMLPMSSPISERPDSPSMPAHTMDQDSGTLTPPMQLPTSDHPESPPPMDDGGSPMPESLETSLALALNSVFQSCPTLSPHLGTVDPSHISLPLNVLEKNLPGQDDIEMGALSDLSSSEDEDSARPAKKTNPEAQSSDNDDTDDEESSSSSSDESTDSDLKKPIGKTSRGDPGNLKKPRVGSSTVDAKGPKTEASQVTGREDNPRKRSRFSSVGDSPALQGKDEEISLSREEAPRIVCDRSFTVYDIDGNPHEFTPEFHHGVFNDQFQEFMQLVYDGYIEGRPPHIMDPQNSSLAKLHHQDFLTINVLWVGEASSSSP